MYVPGDQKITDSLIAGYSWLSDGHLGFDIKRSLSRSYVSQVLYLILCSGF